MTFNILISEEAQWDIEESFAFYEAVQPGLGLRFEEDLDNSIQAIAANPKTCQLKYRRTIRIVFTKSFPFGIHYFIDGADVKVIAVFHTSRSPKNWDSRIK